MEPNFMEQSTKPCIIEVPANLVNHLVNLLDAGVRSTGLRFVGPAAEITVIIDNALKKNQLKVEAPEVEEIE